MNTHRKFVYAIVALCNIAVIVVVVMNMHSATEFSPDALIFRNALYLGEIRIVPTGTWSTPLLDETREKNPLDGSGTLRWTYVHGSNMFGRPCFANGDGKPAYRLFRSGVWDDVLGNPKNNRDEVIKKAVSLMRELKYGAAAEFLYDVRFSEK